MTNNTPQTVAELRAQIAAGIREASKVYRTAAASGLKGAAQMADRLDKDAERNERLAKS